jgi:hypothetical protein
VRNRGQEHGPTDSRQTARWAKALLVVALTCPFATVALDRFTAPSTRAQLDGRTAPRRGRKRLLAVNALLLGPLLLLRANRRGLVLTRLELAPLPQTRVFKLGPLL